MSAVFLVFFFSFFVTKTFAKLSVFSVRTSVYYDEISLSSLKSLISGFIHVHRVALRNRSSVSLIRFRCGRSDVQHQSSGFGFGYRKTRKLAWKSFSPLIRSRINRCVCVRERRRCFRGGTRKRISSKVQGVMYKYETRRKIK